MSLVRQSPSGEQGAIDLDTGNPVWDKLFERVPSEF